MVIKKQDFEIYLDMMMDYFGVKDRNQLLISAYKITNEGDSVDIFEEAKLISTFESGIVVLRNGYEEEDEEEDEKEVVFIPWSSIDELIIMKKQAEDEY